MQTMIIESENHNVLERRVMMPQGIIGFGGIQHFTLTPLGKGEGAELFWELQSIEAPDASFILIALKESHLGDLAIADLDLCQAVKHLGINIADSEVYLIISIEIDSNGQKSVTANVRAPFIFHSPSNRGWQVVLADAKYPMAQLI